MTHGRIAPRGGILVAMRGRRGVLHHLVAALYASLLLVILADPARAQVFFAPTAAPMDAEAIAPAQQPFALPAQSSEAAEAMADFQRYANRGIWEKAFKSLDTAASKGQGLIVRPDGVLLPGALSIQQALAGLSPSGKAAYRLFYDAQARTLLGQAQGKDEADNLSKIVSNYIVTSVGDLAADRLGDLCFEEGKFDGAVRAWQAIINYRSDSSIDRALLYVKLAIALAHSGRWDEFHRVERELADRHPGAQVTLGGKLVSAERHLAQIGAGQKAASPPTADTPDFKLPDSDEPLWQWRPFGKPTDANAAQIPRFRNPWGQHTTIDMVIPTISDGRRVYANLLGYEVALDLQSGKLLWRNGKYRELVVKAAQQQVIFPEVYNLTIAGDRLWSVGAALGGQGPRGGSYLKALDPATGKELWHSRNLTALQPWSFCGAPVVDGDRLYIGALKNNPNTELHVLALATADGKPLWDSMIGNHKVDQYQAYYYRKTAQPMMVLNAGKLYVDTHAGAMAALDAGTGTMLWGMVYPSAAIKTGYDYEGMTDTFTVGKPIYAADMLFLKGMRSSRLIALRPQEPALAFNRSVSNGAVLIGVDNGRVYVGGEEITAYDLRTRELLWSRAVPMGTSFLRPVMTRSHIFQFTARGIYQIEKATGKLVRLFRGSDLGSNGGAILLAPKLLITSSGLAVTAYRVES